jgi:hypothetical protein
MISLVERAHGGSAHYNVHCLVPSQHNFSIFTYNRKEPILYFSLAADSYGFTYGNKRKKVFCSIAVSSESFVIEVQICRDTIGLNTGPTNVWLTYTHDEIESRAFILKLYKCCGFGSRARDPVLFYQLDRVGSRSGIRCFLVLDLESRIRHVFCEIFLQYLFD